MKRRIFAIVGLVFVVSIVRADPIAPQSVVQQGAAQQAVRAGAIADQGSRANQTQRPTNGALTAKSGMPTQTQAPPPPSRAVASRAGNVRAESPQTSRSVVARTATAQSGAATQARTVRARVGSAAAGGGASPQTASRVSHAGSALRAPTTIYAGISGAYAAYSNIIDPMTGLISAEAYNNCVTSYYTCMDEICTARSPGQRRCACAGRVKTFAALEQTLQAAREDLLKVSGELSLLIMSKGESLTSAFSLTDAEKTMNCVSWRDVVVSGGDKNKWCYDHFIGECTASTGLNSDKAYSCASCKEPAYCAATVENGGLGLGANWQNILDGSDSDIIAALRAYADATQSANVIITNRNDDLGLAIRNVEDVINSLNGGSALFGLTATAPDNLAETWGYNLFQFAHNNVCSRVLDACFNGIFETCGNDCKTGIISSNGQKQCNLNSQISVINSGQDLEFKIKGNNTLSGNAAAACFGYANTAGDPYGTLRGPVADARRSVLQKYALDANADCDIYGEELKKQAQNMNYQKIAATQLLQQKRLEFATDKMNSNKSGLADAKQNFHNCVAEIYDCYETQDKINPSWPLARIKSYCTIISNVPSCYETMVCDQESGMLIDSPDMNSCTFSADWTKNTCRNIVVLAEITGKASTSPEAPVYGKSGDSRKFREYCLMNAPGVSGTDSIRDWSKAPIVP